MEQSKRSVEDDTQANQDGDDQLPTIKKAKLDKEDDQKKEEPTISDKYNSDDADITLISSDNIAFKVHSYQLMAASTVFRSMLSMPNPIPDPKRAPIELSDPMLEHSWALKPLLDVVYNMDTSLIDSGRRTHLVLALADKWEFAQARALIRAAVSNQVLDKVVTHGSRSFKKTFDLCLALKDPKLAAACLRVYRNDIWSASPSPELKTDLNLPFSKDAIRPRYDDCAPGLTSFGALHGAKVLDLATWGYKGFLKIPPTIVWAMLRATHLGSTRMAVVDHEKVSEEFGRLLTLAFEPKKEVSAEET